MNPNRVVTALLLIAALVALVAPAAAQYMYLDTNGNGVHDSGDRLAPNGTSTTVDVWLVTNKNRDGSAATCAVDPTAPMALNDYYVNFKAAGGLVTYSGFVTHFGNPPIGQYDPGDGVQYGNGLFGPFIVESDLQGNSLFAQHGEVINAGIEKLYAGLKPPALHRYGETDDRRNEVM